MVPVGKEGKESHGSAAGSRIGMKVRNLTCGGRVSNRKEGKRNSRQGVILPGPLQKDNGAAE